MKCILTIYRFDNPKRLIVFRDDIQVEGLNNNPKKILKWVKRLLK